MERVWGGSMGRTVLATAGQSGQDPMGSAGTCDHCNRIFVYDSLRPGETRCPYCHNLLHPTTWEELRAKLRREPPPSSDDGGG